MNPANDFLFKGLKQKQNPACRTSGSAQPMKYLILMACVFFLFGIHTTAFAELSVISDAEMEAVTAQSGISIHMDMAIGYSADVIKFSDTDLDDPHWIEFQGFSITDGINPTFSLKTSIENPVTFDVASTASGNTMVAVNLTQYTQPRTITVDSLVFCDQAMGSLNIDHLIQHPSLFRVGASINEGNAVAWDYATQLHMDSLTYKYNDAGDAFSMDGIHIAGSAAGIAEDPSTWDFNGQFTIGDMENNPATFNVGTNGDGLTVLEMGLPMQGAIRIENISIGARSLGPVVIDGLQVHRLTVGIVP